MKKSKEPVEAPDAIPEDGILLVDTYQHVLGSIWDHPERTPKFDDHWSEILDESEKEFAKIHKEHDTDAYDAEAKKILQTSMMANLCLRLALEEEELVAYVRDPKSDRILRLSVNGWTEDIGVPVPDGIWNNYLAKGDGAHPGPQGTLINGELQPVYLKRKDFEKWLSSIFSGEPKDEAIVRQRYAPEQARIAAILKELWPGQTLPNPDLTKTKMLATIEATLEKQKRRPIVERTYWRFWEGKEYLTIPANS